MEHAGLGALPGESRLERIKRQRQEKGPVLWPGMDGLGANTFTKPPTMTIHDDAIDAQNAVKEKANAQMGTPVPAVAANKGVKNRP
jgi:hypothetical protein